MLFTSLSFTRHILTLFISRVLIVFSMHFCVWPVLSMHCLPLVCYPSSSYCWPLCVLPVIAMRCPSLAVYPLSPCIPPLGVLPAIFILFVNYLNSSTSCVLPVHHANLDLHATPSLAFYPSSPCIVHLLRSIRHLHALFTALCVIRHLHIIDLFVHFLSPFSVHFLRFTINALSWSLLKSSRIS